MNDLILLLRTLLLSTSQRNIYKYTTDKKKKRNIRLAFVGMFFLYLMIMGYSIAMCIGYGHYGLIDQAPLMCVIIISLLAFVFTILKTNGYLFGFKEYDMLMALPFKAKTVAAGKFLYMYVKNIPWYLSVSVAMMIGYGIYKKPSVVTYILWIVFTFVLPLIPMLIAAFIGFIIARVSSGFKKRNILQTVLTFVFIILCFSLRYIIEGIFKNDKVEETINSTAKAMSNVAKIYLPAKWFQDAVVKYDIVSIILLAGVSIALCLIVFVIVGKSYSKINSSIKSHSAKRNYKMQSQKTRSVTSAIAFKELKRLTGSTVYMTNGALGEILVVLLGIVTLIIGFNKIISVVTQNAPLDTAMVQPAIPFIIYFFIGMVATTVFTPSLEGKNYWIVKSLPISERELYGGKMLFNMCLTVPAMLISTLCFCISAKVSVAGTILYIVLGFLLCAFSTARGMLIGIKHLRLDWENEIEVIKQGSAVAIYIFPNMFITMIVTVLAVYLGTKINHLILASIFIAVAILLTAIYYLRTRRLYK